MRLKTQFAVLTVAVTTLPVVFALIFFGFQQAPRDPRAPTRDFIGSLARQWHKGAELTRGAIIATAEEAGMPLREFALLSSDGDVVLSTFAHIQGGGRIKLTDLSSPPRVNQNQPRPELKLLPLDPTRTDSPLIFFDIQPFWTRQDIRNRNALFISLFALVIFIVSGVISFGILRSISRAIKTIEKDTSIVATGNLDHEVAGLGNHEILLLAKSINLMRLNLKDMLVRRSKMLMGISHDLKTPIALIQGYADALADNVAADPQTRERYVEIIQTKAKQLEDLTGDLMDFMKIGGDGTIAVEVLDPGILLKELGGRFESDAALLGRTLIWGFGDEAAKEPKASLPSIAMNRPLVERAMENLLTNAFKYSRTNGVIELKLLEMDGALAFSVRDDGPGIAEDDMPFVFDAFYRGSPSRSDGGHGFGLTIVKAVADLHGWSTSVGPRKDGKEGTEAILRMKA